MTDHATTDEIAVNDESSPLLLGSTTNNNGLGSLFEQPSETTSSNPLQFLESSLQDPKSHGEEATLFLPPQRHHHHHQHNYHHHQHQTRCGDPSPSFSSSPQEIQSTLIGSIVFLLYQVVFCLAQAATITRPHATHSSTGVMAQLAALGVLTGGPLFLWELADQVPAIYPASDLFLAPFLAGLAQTIDQVLWQRGLQDNDSIFLATFGLLLAVGLALSGALCILAARVKLANVGAFLPHSVLCGFFSTIGILMWTLGFSVDVGHKIGQVITSGDVQLFRYAILHHFPSLCVGILMHLLGPKNPLFVILLVFGTIAGSYAMLWVTSTTLVEAQANNWFFSANDLIPQKYPTLSLNEYALPAPFGVWVSVWRGDVCWEAFMAGVPMMLALVVLYLVRCSLHSAALKKNIPLVTRKPEPVVVSEDDSTTNSASIRSSSLHSSSRRGGSLHHHHHHKKLPLTLNFILEHGYGYSQLLSGLVGGIAIAPSVAASLTLFKLRAETPPPQYGSCLLIIVFYCSNFTLVQYIPKPAFSALMVLAGLDMVRTWTYDSYWKTKAKLEWCVGPVLVVLSFSIGVLYAILAGVAMSTFIFAANFYSAGAVKFIGNGLTLRSAVERGVRESEWLDQHGDWIQILVVQNYLFFGNCQSLLTYITTMFEDDPIETTTHFDSSSSSIPIPPKPKYLILDFTLVSGMDTSAVDILQEIVKLCCETNHARLYLSGLKSSFKSKLVYAGLKASTRRRRWMFTHDMETALANAEDALVSNEFHWEEWDRQESRIRSNSIQEEDDDGFLYSLQKIDEQHGLTTATDLAGLAAWTHIVELDKGEVLVREKNPGLYFVETGLLRVQWALAHATRNSTVPRHSGDANASIYSPSPLEEQEENAQSIGHLNARSATIGRQMALWKVQHQHHPHPNASNGNTANEQQSFRLARIGQGWIIGSIEASNGMKKPGVHVAISACRLHHLPASAIQQLQEENPRLAMHLYRVLAHLATKRQEMTIDHLGQHLRIMNSPVPRLRGRGRAGLAQLHQPVLLMTNPQP